MCPIGDILGTNESLEATSIIECYQKFPSEFYNSASLVYSVMIQENWELISTKYGSDGMLIDWFIQCIITLVSNLA